MVGACVAREVSSKGLKVALIERGEFGQATSANSLQILHGGLRYLKRLDLYHAYHYVKEQRAWVEASPTLIRPLRCEVALGSKFNWRHAVYFCGLQFYNLLCWNRNRGFSANKKLPSAGLTRSGVAYWYDLQMTDPVALVRTITEQAGRQGALLIKRREVTDGSVDGQTRSLVCRDRETGAQDEVRASVVVTAVGPATNRILRTFGAPPSRVHWIQGINALFDLPAGPSALARKGKSGRMFLLTPLGNQTLVGTGQFPLHTDCLLYTSPSPRDRQKSRMPSSA